MVGGYISESDSVAQAADRYNVVWSMLRCLEDVINNTPTIEETDRNEYIHKILDDIGWFLSTGNCRNISHGGIAITTPRSLEFVCNKDSNILMHLGNGSVL